MLDSIVNNNFLFPLIVSIIICVCYYVYNEKYNTEENKSTTTTYVKLFISSLSLLIGASYIIGSNKEDNFDLLGENSLSNILPNFSNKNTQETLENTNNDVEKSNTSENVITPNTVHTSKKIVNTSNTTKETTTNENRDTNTNTSIRNNTRTNNNARNQEDFLKTTKFNDSNNDQRVLNVDNARKVLSPNSVKKIEKFLTGNPDF